MSTEAKVGLFVAAGILAVGYGIYFVRTTQTVRGKVPYVTYLRYAGGVAPGSDVLFGGIKVGQVSAVRPWSQDPTRIEVAFQVRAGTPLNQNSKAHTGSVGLMSSPVLFLTTGTNDARRLGAGEMVASEEATSMDEITRRAATLEDSANELVGDLRRDIPDLTAQARKLLTNLNQISGPRNQKQISQILDQMNTLLNRESPKIARITDQLSDLAKHSDAVVTSVQPLVSNMDKTVTDVDRAATDMDKTVNRVSDPLTKDLADLEQTLEKARTLLSSMQSTVDTNQEDVTETVRNLRNTTENVQAFSETLKQRPWNLIRTTQPPDRRVPK